MKKLIAKQSCLKILIGLVSLFATVLNANEDEGLLDRHFLEFLGEGALIDGDYTDPLQIGETVNQDLAETGVEQAGDDHETQ